MIRHKIDVRGYWTIISYYDITEEWYSEVVKELKAYGARKKDIKAIYDEMFIKHGYGFSFTNPDEETSIIGVIRTNSEEEFLDTVVHEADHVKNAISEYYNANTLGEDGAHLIGFIVKQSYKVFSKFLCKC